MVKFIAVPLKSTNDVDLIKPLKAYIDSLSELSDDAKIEANEGIIELNKLRNRACIQSLEIRQASLDLLIRYSDQLHSIENKLPITPTQNPVSFKWRDAFDKGSLFFSRAALTISDSSFERACVLFNCASLMSNLGSSQQIHTDEELKSMAKLFQQSAGIFSKLKETILALVQQDPTPDLMPDTLSCLSQLMITQAQEAIYIKAQKDEMKPASLVKISAQVAEFYQDLQKLMSREQVKGIWEKEWLQTITGKGFVYNALAQYHGSQVLAEEKNFGGQICRLQEAMKLVEQSGHYINSSIEFQSEVNAIKKSLDTALKDNSFIYHARVPDMKTMPQLLKAVLAKPILPTFPMNPHFRDLFESLIPVSVQNALSIFESRKNGYINSDVGRMREYTQLLNACLATLNLPAALDDVTKYEKCPNSIREKSSKVKVSGGITALRAKSNELPNLYKRNEEILNETSRILNDEKETDNKIRNQFGVKWTRVPSEQLTVPLIQELGKYRGILNTAANADGIVRKKFGENARGIELLSMNEADLKNAIPGIDEQSNINSSTVSKLRDLMNKVQEIKVEREAIEKELKNVHCDMGADFLKSLSDEGVLNEQRISEEKLLNLFKPFKDRIDKSIKSQEALVSEIGIMNNKFTDERKSTTGAVDRETLLKQLARAFDTYLELENNLNEGTKFYNDLTPLLLRLQQKVSDFCYARQTEKEDLMKQVQQNIVSNSSGTDARQPPPRPPPPQAQQQTPSAPIPPPQYINPTQSQPQTQMPYQQPQYQPNPYVPYSQPMQPIYQYGAPPYPMQYPTHPHPYAQYAPQPNTQFMPQQQPPYGQQMPK